MWYLDCYCYLATDGVNVPIHAYSCEDVKRLAEIAGKLLANSLHGIDECRISESTKHGNPTPVNESKFVKGLK